MKKIKKWKKFVISIVVIIIVLPVLVIGCLFYFGGQISPIQVADTTELKERLPDDFYCIDFDTCPLCNKDLNFYIYYKGPKQKASRIEYYYSDCKDCTDNIDLVGITVNKLAWYIKDKNDYVDYTKIEETINNKNLSVYYKLSDFDNAYFNNVIYFDSFKISIKFNFDTSQYSNLSDEQIITTFIEDNKNYTATILDALGEVS